MAEPNIKFRIFGKSILTATKSLHYLPDLPKLSLPYFYILTSQWLSSVDRIKSKLHYVNLRAQLFLYAHALLLYLTLSNSHLSFKDFLSSHVL